MQIVTLDVDGELCDIEPMLFPLVNSDDQFTAAKGQMFLDLVRYLRASGPEPRLVGQLVLDELDLWPMGQETPATVSVRADWYDCGPRYENDLPRMHYRLTVRPVDGALSRDIRTVDLARVEQELQRAFSWDT